MLKVFVTGSSGFVGKNLVGRLESKGYDVIGCDLPTCDITNLNQLINLMKDCDAVIHLAAMTKAGESFKNPQKYIKINTMGTINILESMRIHGIKRLVCISSGGVAGEKRYWSPYLWSKHLAELGCKMYHQSYGIDIVILRPTNIYGPKNWKGVSHIFLQSKKEGRPVTITGDGSQARDFVHVHDVCDAIILALESKLKFKKFVIGTGVATSIKQLADIIGVEYTLTMKFDNVGLRESVADTKPAEKYLGFKAKISIEEGTKRLLEEE
jgi:UDP-glucose 4-epimerase